MAVIETAVMDNLIASNSHPVTVQTCVIASGEGELTRGTVLMRKSNGKYVAAADDGATPPVKYGTCELVLADDVDATSADAVARAYNSGEFNSRDIVAGTGYTLDADDIADLKNAGIYLATSVEVDPA